MHAGKTIGLILLIAAAGITLEDAADGTHWNLAGSQPGAKEN